MIVAFSKLPKFPKLPKFSLLCFLFSPGILFALFQGKGSGREKGNFLFIFDMFTHLSVIFCLHTPALLFLVES